jgi:hypothetical protein
LMIWDTQPLTCPLLRAPLPLTCLHLVFACT